jgi:predicted DCC family thiol-disulfide oxidoreductase YuxK
MAVKPTPDSVPGPVVLYDAGCGFCRWTLAKLLAWDRRRALRPVPIDSMEGEVLLADLSEEERGASWHLLVGGYRFSAGAAFPPLLRLLPGGRPLAWLTARFPRVTRAGYGLIAASRSTIGPLIPAGAVRRAERRIEGRSA